MRTFLFSFLYMSFTLHVVAADLTVTVENIQNDKGKIHIAIFNDTNDFPDVSARTDGIILDIEQQSVTGTFINLVENSYAIAVFHDENGNGKLDKNFFGIPKEPYGFSGNSTSITPPSFDEASIKLTTNNINLAITLR